MKMFQLQKKASKIRKHCRSRFTKGKTRKIFIHPEKTQLDIKASPRNVSNTNCQPITCTIDYTKLLCDESSPFFYDNSSDDECSDPSYHISSNFSSPEKALNLTIEDKSSSRPQLQIEFSNSPKFLTDSHQLEQCLIEKNMEPDETNSHHSINNLLSQKVSFLSDNSNFYINNIDDVPLKVTDLTTFYNQVHEDSQIEDKVHSDNLKEFNKSNYDGDTEINSLLDRLRPKTTETRLPFKKRRMSVCVKQEVLGDQDKKEISYPSTPMISIAEVEALNKCLFKTPAELKEMSTLPPLLAPSNPAPAVYHIPVTNVEQFTYHPNYYLPRPTYPIQLDITASNLQKEKM